MYKMYEKILKDKIAKYGQNMVTITTTIENKIAIKITPQVTLTKV